MDYPNILVSSEELNALAGRLHDIYVDGDPHLYFMLNNIHTETRIQHEADMRHVINILQILAGETVKPEDVI